MIGLQGMMVSTAPVHPGAIPSWAKPHRRHDSSKLCGSCLVVWQSKIGNFNIIIMICKITFIYIELAYCSQVPAARGGKLSLPATAYFGLMSKKATLSVSNIVKLKSRKYL